MSIFNKYWIAFFISGLVYAGISAGFDYKSGEIFDLQKFLIQGASFGVIMVVIQYFWDKKNLKKNKREKV